MRRSWQSITTSASSSSLFYSRTRGFRHFSRNHFAVANDATAVAAADGANAAADDDDDDDATPRRRIAPHPPAACRLGSSFLMLRAHPQQQLSAREAFCRSSSMRYFSSAVHNSGNSSSHPMNDTGGRRDDEEEEEASSFSSTLNDDDDDNDDSISSSNSSSSKKYSTPTLSFSSRSSSIPPSPHQALTMLEEEQGHPSLLLEEDHYQQQQQERRRWLLQIVTTSGNFRLLERATRQFDDEELSPHWKWSRNDAECWLLLVSGWARMPPLTTNTATTTTTNAGDLHRQQQQQQQQKKIEKKNQKKKPEQAAVTGAVVAAQLLREWDRRSNVSNASSTTTKDGVVPSLLSPPPLAAFRTVLMALDLIVAFIGASNKDIDADTRVVLYQGFADAVSHGGQPKNDSFLGPFLSSCLASDIFYSGQDKNRRLSSQLSSQILSQVAVAKRVQAVLILVSYARDIVMRLGGEEVPESNDLVPLDALSGMAEKGPDRQKMKPNLSTAPSKETLRKLCVALMAGTCEIFSSPAFARFLRHCKSDSSTPVVRLWQDLLLIQSILNSQLGTAEGNALDFWTSIAEVTNETLESIQNHLPSHIFLAFATSLVKESDSEDLRSRALQLVADRSLLLDSSDPESCLFLDMLPYLSTLFYTGNDTAGVFLVQQSALIAVEHITRKFCFDSGGPGVKYLDMVSQALTKAAEVINTQCRGIDLTTVNAKGLGNQTTKLLCTATLCAATTIRACGARALPALPNLLRTSLQLFGQVNTLLSKPIDDEGDENQSRILQLSILRLLAATVETIPQFVGPYLPDMFQPTVLPSAALQEGCDEQSVSIKTAAVGLCQAIAKKVPARQLFTPLTDALLKPDSVGGLTTLLDIMTMSISNSKATELGGKVNAILKAGTSVYDFAAEHQHGGELVAASTKMFMALVLKLSELQLRSLYSKLRAWRGDFDKDSPKNSAFKRYCFWSLSASLATQLRSIFLPCFATVFSDAVDELDAAVSNVCSRNGIKVAGGRKKQRLAGDLSFEYDHDSLVSLQAVLKCLEVSLRSDAHEGGSWIRDGESERFELLLGPLGKLFHSQVDNHISYQDLVQGPGQKEDDSGCVTECIVALASAAGDEQKWKPLNHAVLQACSHETRGEVRKAGVRCLLSLIKSIGEEYMVLIPECLPVLSELLEDSDEEIAGFAQECITSSEELLGESLEDSLL